MFNVTSYLSPLNATMTRYLEFNSTDNLIYFNIDGRFKDLVSHKHEVPANLEWASRQNATQKEQFFMHESTLNSLILANANKMFPY